MRDWAEAFGHDVRIVDRTASLGAINVTGPKAKELLARVGATDLPAFMGHGDIESSQASPARRSGSASPARSRSSCITAPTARSSSGAALLEAGADVGVQSSRPRGAPRPAAREGPHHPRAGHRPRLHPAAARDGVGRRTRQDRLRRRAGARPHRPTPARPRSSSGSRSTGRRRSRAACCTTAASSSARSRPPPVRRPSAGR